MEYLWMPFILFQVVGVLATPSFCPDNTIYVESENVCIFFLVGRHNYTIMDRKCKNFEAVLLSTKNITYANEICYHTKTYYPEAMLTFLDARLKGSSKLVIWSDNTTVTIPPQYWIKPLKESYRCLALLLTQKDKCYFTRANCEDRVSGICTFLRANPCVYNNGGCQHICSPRQIRERTCLCQEGFYKINETHCQPTPKPTKGTQFCPFYSKYLPDVGVCVHVTMLKSVTTSLKTNCQALNGSLHVLTPRLPMYSICQFIREALPVPIWQRYVIELPKGLIDHADYPFCYRRTAPISGASVRALEVSPLTCCLGKVAEGSKAHGICTFPGNDICSDSNGKCNDLCVQTGYKSHTCLCTPGKSLISGKCVYEDECAKDNGDCQHTCTHTSTGPKCHCPVGFMVNGTECQDIDECSVKNGMCSQFCVNTLGSWVCRCDLKYYYNIKDGYDFRIYSRNQIFETKIYENHVECNTTSPPTSQSTTSKSVLADPHNNHKTMAIISGCLVAFFALTFSISMYYQAKDALNNLRAEKQLRLSLDSDTTNMSLELLNRGQGARL